MLFNSWEFAVFLPVVLAVYYCLTTRAQNVFILVASYVFYGRWDWRFLILLMLSTVVDYACALAIERGSSASRRKWVLAAALSFNIGLLAFFKYFNFFVDSMGALLESAGWHANMPLLRVVLPVGISFYTFQSMSYTIDVYRGRTRAEHDFLLYAMFVSFFPQLVAGPIERAPHLLHQLRNDRVVDAEKIRTGLMLILIGLFKKMAIADAVAPTVQQAFSHAGDASATFLLRGVWLFAIQIYCDFSGYTDIARGVARLLGVELMENFNQPYLSRSVTEFWRRWHISLSSWLRDYLYIPLGGNRHGTLMTYRNLFLTMVIGGLWHGANWTFVIWGALHGVYLAIHKLLLGDRREDPDRPWSVTDVLKVLGTFHLVMLTWVFFRAPDVGVAGQYLTGIFTLRGGLSGLFDNATAVAFFLGLLLLIDLPQYAKRNHTTMLGWPWPVRGAAIAVMVILLMILSPDDQTPFIYFQF